jgi:hypothetical protein
MTCELFSDFLRKLRSPLPGCALDRRNRALLYHTWAGREKERTPLNGIARHRTCPAHHGLKSRTGLSMVKVNTPLSARYGKRAPPRPSDDAP